MGRSQLFGISYGSLQVATPQQAQETHAFVRKWFADNVSDTVSKSVRILYGEVTEGLPVVTSFCPSFAFPFALLPADSDLFGLLRVL